MTNGNLPSPPGGPVPPPPPGGITPPPGPPPGLAPKKKRNTILIVIGVIVALAIIGGIISSANKKSTKKKTETQVEEVPAVPETPVTPTETSPPVTPATPPAPPVNAGTMSLAEFGQIQNGMSYEQVCAIVGGPGEVMSESGSPGSEYYTVMYTWEGEGSLGANANCMFQGGALMNKAQFGLE